MACRLPQPPAKLFLRASSALGTLPHNMAETPMPLSDPSSAEVVSSPPERQPGLFGFWCLIATQFQCALSDNALKWLLCFFLLWVGPLMDQLALHHVLLLPSL